MKRNLAILMIGLFTGSASQASEVYCSKRPGQLTYKITPDFKSVYIHDSDVPSVTVSTIASRGLNLRLHPGGPIEAIVETIYKLVDGTELVTQIPDRPNSEGIGVLRAADGSVEIEFEVCGRTP